MSAFSSAIDAFRRGDLPRARELATRQLEAAPTPQLHHLLGLLDCREGRLAKGVEHLEAAVAGEPANTAFQVMLARALIDFGRSRDVLQMTEPAGCSSPDALALWHARAEAAQKVDDSAAAISAWRAIANARKSDARAWINLGRLLLREGAFEDAGQAYRRALAISPSDPDAIGELALLYDRISQSESMAAILEGAAAAGVGQEQLPLAWAILEEQRGNSKKALDLLSSPAPPRDAIRWHRLKAKIHDSLGNSAKAFGEMAAMNRATPDYAAWRRRAAAYRAQLHSLAGAITQEWAAGVPSLAPEGRQPVFLLGFPRSGTTLLDTFLMGHRDILVIEEQPLLFDVLGEVGSIENLAAIDVETLRGARERYLRRLEEEADDGSPIIIDKFPLNMAAAPLIHVLFPSAPIIFAKRHPCDTVLSGFMQAFVANLGMASFLDIRDSADFYDACMSVWSASCSALPLNVHTVRYESLVADPAATLRPVVEFLGLSWDGQLLDHQRTAVRRGHIPNTSHDQVTKPLNTAAVERWRKYEKELEPVLPQLLPWAERLGY
jgi:Flp pilus assembly protein TadD